MIRFPPDSGFLLLRILFAPVKSKRRLNRGRKPQGQGHCGPADIFSRSWWRPPRLMMSVVSCKCQGRGAAHQHLEQQGLVPGGQLGGLAAHPAAHMALLQDLLCPASHRLNFISVCWQVFMPLLQWHQNQRKRNSVLDSLKSDRHCMYHLKGTWLAHMFMNICILRLNSENVSNIISVKNYVTTMW